MQAEESGEQNGEMITNFPMQQDWACTNLCLSANERTWLRNCAHWVHLLAMGHKHGVCCNPCRPCLISKAGVRPRVMAPVLLTSATTWAFCMGVTRQHTTPRQEAHSCRKGLAFHLSSATAKADPSITSPTFGLNWQHTNQLHLIYFIQSLSEGMVHVPT